MAFTPSPEAVIQSGTLPVSVPADIYSILFEWMPTVSGTCSQSACAVPVRGAIVYSILLIAVWLAGTTVKQVLAQNDVTEPASEEVDDEDTSGSDEAGQQEPPSDPGGPRPGETAEHSSSVSDGEEPVDQPSNPLTRILYAILAYGDDGDMGAADSVGSESTDIPAENTASSSSEFIPANEQSGEQFQNPIADAYTEKHGRQREYRVGDYTVTPSALAQDEHGEIDPSADDIISQTEELEKRSIAASGISRGFYTARIGSKYRRVLFAEDWPSPLDPAPLLDVFNDPSLGYDMSIHFEPKDRRKAIRDAEQKADSLRAEASVQNESGGSGSQYAANDKMRKAHAMESIRESMKEGSQPFDTSLYVSVAGDTEDEVDNATSKLASKMLDKPAEIKLSTIRGRQPLALQSVSPLGYDKFAAETDVDTGTVLLGGGVSALLSSMSVSGEMDPNGIEIGEHVTNGMPLIRDPFNSETNYNQVIIGDSGAGKSYNIKLQAIREAARTDDRMIIMLDPLEGFHGLAAALDAERILVGGERGFNPLEIEKPSDEAIERAKDNNQLKSKVKSVLSFFENYFETQGLEGDLGKKRVILNEALYQTYYDAGITKDPYTHAKESPTIIDVREKLKEIANNGDLMDPATEEEKADIEESAAQVHTMLRPFESGEYENLGKRSDIDITGNDFIYVDLSPQESSEGGGSGLMMQLLFQILYEQAKATPKEVIFIIDEAQFMLKEGSSLEFLSQRVRHARHFDMSIRFATQNVKDFMRTDQASDIINNAYLSIYHRTTEIEEFIEDLDITPAHAGFIKDARSGENYDHSQALYQINNDFYPAKITSQPAEHKIVSFEPGDDKTELPGITKSEESRLVKGIQHQLEKYAEKAAYDASLSGPVLPGDKLENSARTLSPEEKQAIQFIGWEYMVEALERIDEGEEPQKVISEYIDKKFDQMVDTLGEQQILNGLSERTVRENAPISANGESENPANPSEAGDD